MTVLDSAAGQAIAADASAQPSRPRGRAVVALVDVRQCHLGEFGGGGA